MVYENSPLPSGAASRGVFFCPLVDCAACNLWYNDIVVMDENLSSADIPLGDSPDEALRWQNTLNAHPKLWLNPHNTERKQLLLPGVFVDISPVTARSWFPDIWLSDSTSNQVAVLLESEKISSKPVRVTIKSIPPETQKDVVGGIIVVDVDGVEHIMDSSVFYNCTHRGLTGIIGKIIVSNGGISWRDSSAESDNGVG